MAHSLYASQPGRGRVASFSDVDGSTPLRSHRRQRGLLRNEIATVRLSARRQPDELTAAAAAAGNDSDGRVACLHFARRRRSPTPGATSLLTQSHFPQRSVAKLQHSTFSHHPANDARPACFDYCLKNSRLDLISRGRTYFLLFAPASG